MNILLKPAPKTLYEIQPERSHARLSLSRVLWAKLLRWVDKASAEALRKALARFLFVCCLFLAGMAPSFFLGVVTSAARWNGYRLPIVILLFIVIFKAPAAYRLLRRKPWRRGNQNTYRGVPVDELASFLIEQKQFTRDDAMRTLGISQGKHQQIADELEKHQVLIRGENNARVLNTITREQLVRQLREKFPLAFHDGEWAERKGSYETFLREKERAEQKERASLERLERKRDRLQTETSTFQRILAMQ